MNPTVNRSDIHIDGDAWVQFGDTGLCADWPDSNGKRRIAVTEPCGATVAHVFQNWGPVPVERWSSAAIKPWPGSKRRSLDIVRLYVEVEPHGRLLAASNGLGVGDISELLPPDVDPHSLVGRWARGGGVDRGDGAA